MMVGLLLGLLHKLCLPWAEQKVEGTPHLPPFASSPLEEGPLNLARGSEERCKLPQHGLGQSPNRN